MKLKKRNNFKKLIFLLGKTIAIIGGGFLGSEISCALAKFGKTHGGSVVQIFPESGNRHLRSKINLINKL